MIYLNDHKPSLERLMHEYNQVYRLTYLTLFGVRVYFFQSIKNRWGKSGELVVASYETRKMLSKNALVLDDEPGGCT